MRPETPTHEQWSWRPVTGLSAFQSRNTYLFALDQDLANFF